MVVISELGVELVGLTLKEPIEAVKTSLKWPLVKRPGRGCILGIGQMPFTGAESGIVFFSEHLGDGGRVVGYAALPVWITGVYIGYRPHAHSVVIAPGEKAGTRGRA